MTERRFWLYTAAWFLAGAVVTLLAVIVKEAL